MLLDRARPALPCAGGGVVIDALLLHSVTRLRWMAFAARGRALRDFQDRLLLRMVAPAAGSAFGRRHGFAGIRDRAAYQKQVPIGGWDDFAPYVDRILAGERHVLNADPPPIMFDRTAGTTGAPKLIPVGRATLRANRTIQKLWAYQAIRQHPRFLDAKAVPLVNQAVEGRTEETGTPYGSVPGLMVRNAPALARRRYAYPYPVVEIADHRARRYALMRIAMQHQVSFIPGNDPSSILGLFESADDAKATLIQDIHDGTLATAVDIPPPLREALAPCLKPDPDRARALERMAAGGTLRPADYWPGLKLIGCWKGGTVGRFAPKLHDWCAPGLVLREAGYRGAEAHVTLPVSDTGSEGLLTIGANVFEFVPLAEWGAPDARALFADQVEAGQCYHILVTTPAGLYRYAMNDVVEVVGVHAGIPLIRFLRRGPDVVATELACADDLEQPASPAH